MLGTILLFLVTVAIGLRLLSWLLSGRNEPRHNRSSTAYREEPEIRVESGYNEHLPSLLRDELWRDPFAHPGQE
jgi:hypothetical protein